MIRSLLVTAAGLLAVGSLSIVPARAQPAPSAVVRLAERGDAAGLRAALADGAAPDARAAAETDAYWGRRTPLMAAARADSDEAVALLLAAGADAAATDSLGRTALWYAAQGDAGGPARRLLAAGTDLYTADADGGTAPGWAAFSDAAGVLFVFLDAGLDPDETDARGTPLLLRAIQTYGSGHANARSVDRLLRTGADPDRGDGRFTPLLKAVSETPGGLLVTHLLVEAGADVVATMGEEETAAARAARLDAPRIVAYYAGDAATVVQARLLAAVLHDDAAAVAAALADGAEPDAGAQGSDFYAADGLDDGAPIHLAVHAAAAAALAALLDGGAAVDSQTGIGTTALGLAAERGDLETLAALLAAGADPDGGAARAFLGMTPVHLAAIGGNADVIQALLEAGGEPGYTTNASMGYGYNALGFAIHYGHADAVRVLLDAGQETTFVGETGEAALDLALERDWPDVADLLRARGAQTDADATQARIDASFADGANWETALSDSDLELARALLGRGDAPPADALRRIVHELRDDLDLIATLVAAGADVDARGDGGRTALHEAAANAFFDLAEALLAVGADPALRDADGRTPLDWALETDDPDTIGLLSDD